MKRINGIILNKNKKINYKNQNGNDNYFMKTTLIWQNQLCIKSGPLESTFTFSHHS